MFSRTITLSESITALAFLGGSVVVGLILYLLLFRRLARRATRESWIGDVVVAAVRHATVVWFAIAGAYIASNIAPLTREARTTVGRVLLALLIISATFVLSRLASDAVRLAVLRSRATGASSILLNITRIVVIVIGLLILLQVLGVPITPLVTALGVGGLAVALALQDSLSNLFGGLHVIASKQIRPGDYVKLDTGDEGYVVDVNWRTTSIRQLAGNTVLVPNSKLAQSSLINYYRPHRDMTVPVDVGVSYDSDLAMVERVTVEVATEVMREVPGSVKDWEPFVRYHTFADSGVELTCVLRAKEFSDRFVVRHEFIKRLHKRFKEEGIQIPFPTRTVHMAPGSEKAPVAKRARRTSRS